MTQSDYIALGLALGVGLFVWSKREPEPTRPPGNGNGRTEPGRDYVAEANEIVRRIESEANIDPTIAAITLEMGADELVKRGAPAEAVEIVRAAARRMRERAQGGGTGPGPGPGPAPAADLDTRYNDLVTKGNAYLAGTADISEADISAMGTTSAELTQAFRFVDAANLASIATQVRAKKGLPTVAYYA